MEPNDEDSEKERSTIQPSGSHVAPYHQQLDEESDNDLLAEFVRQ